MRFLFRNSEKDVKLDATYNSHQITNKFSIELFGHQNFFMPTLRTKLKSNRKRNKTSMKFPAL